MSSLMNLSAAAASSPHFLHTPPQIPLLTAPPPPHPSPLRTSYEYDLPHPSFVREDHHRQANAAVVYQHHQSHQDVVTGNLRESHTVSEIREDRRNDARILQAKELENFHQYHETMSSTTRQYHTAPVTPILGPIYIKNNSVPVVPSFAHPVYRNGTLVHVPILWTALSIALGVQIHDGFEHTIPCFLSDHLLHCPAAGTEYPKDRIEYFIDENKALVRRMFGEFHADTDVVVVGRGKRSIAGVPDLHDAPHEFVNYGPHRSRRQVAATQTNRTADIKRMDTCGSKLETVMPYWASNSAGKTRAVVNTEHFEQAIQTEVCTKPTTTRCQGDCSCEQKYKWHRLLAYDPDNDCKGIFMDWFLYPSCCVCRCVVP